MTRRTNSGSRVHVPLLYQPGILGLVCSAGRRRDSIAAKLASLAQHESDCASSSCSPVQCFSAWCWP